jgi:hypothetical protein
MNIKRVLFVIVATPFLAGLLAADTISLTVFPYSPDYENDGSYYVGLTQGFLTDMNTDVTSSNFWMYCVDFLGTIYPPTSYDVNIVSLQYSSFTGDPPPGINLSLAQLQTDYLLGQDFGTSPGGSATEADDVDIQHAVWNFYGGDFTLGTYATTQLDIAGCETGLYASDSSQCESVTFTPIDPNSSIYANANLLDVTSSSGQQAFMTGFLPAGAPFNNASPLTPEPTTLMLFGTGLLACFAWRSRRRAN